MLYNQVKLSQIKVILLLLWASLLAGCNTKSITQLEEEIVNLEDPFKKKITSFKVTNTPDSINAVINNLNQEIILVLPYYLGLTAVELDIQTAEGFSIVDKPENKLIEDVTPYLLDKQANLIYTLNDSEGHSYNYELILETYQPEITLDEENLRSEYTRTAMVNSEFGPELHRTSIFFKGTNIIKRLNGVELTKVWLIDSDGNEFELNDINTENINIRGYIPLNMELGNYRIRIENYSRAVTLRKIIKLIKRDNEVE
ncbi:MAG: hypothetical protein ACK5H1_10485 [Tenacibaculum sp.]